MRNKAFSGFLFTFLQQIGGQIVGLIILIVLGRLLSPRDFGLVGMVALINIIGEVLIDSGFSKSLLRMIDFKKSHYDVIFSLNLLIGFSLYTIVYIIAPFIADYFKEPDLTPIVRVMSLTLLVSSLTSTQTTYLIRELKFKTLALISITGSAIGAGIGIFMAIKGLGVWSIIFTTLSTVALSSAGIWFASDWRPERLYLDRKIIKKHFNFGYKLTITNFLDAISRNLYNIVLGRSYTPEIVGYYTRSNSMKNVAVFSLITSVNKVSYPLMAKIQEDSKHFSLSYKRVIHLVSFFSIPVLIYSSFFAKEIIVFLLTDKWKLMVPYFQILCLAGILYPVTSFNTNALSVLGKSDVVLKLAVMNKTILIVMILLASNFNIMILISTYVAYSVIEYLITIFITRNFIDYPPFNQISDLLPQFFSAAVSGFGVFYLFGKLCLNNFFAILLSLPLFFIGYFLLCFLLKDKGVLEVVNFIPTDFRRLLKK